MILYLLEINFYCRFGSSCSIFWDYVEKKESSPFSVPGIIVSLIALASILSADQTENKIFCTQLNDSLPGITKVALDAFTIHDGVASKCEEHSKEEWVNLLTSEQYGFVNDMNTALTLLENKPKNGVCIYEHFIKDAAKNKFHY